MSSNLITNRTIKPFIKAHDFYLGYKLEEECFSKDIIKDVDQKSKFRSKKKSDLEQSPMSWPRLKPQMSLPMRGFLKRSLTLKLVNSIQKKMMGELSRIQALLITSQTSTV